MRFLWVELSMSGAVCMYSVSVVSALLCISTGATFIGNSLGSQLSGGQGFLYANEYPTSEETQKRLVREPPLIKRGIDPFSIPTLIKEPPLKRGDKRDAYVYPATSSQLSDRIPLREPPLKRGDLFSEAVYVKIPELESNEYENELIGANESNTPDRAWLLDRSTKRVSDSESSPRSQLRAQRLLSRIWH
ncbi:hypothetical protein GCK32_009126 [Trichostrongylus colubriformis]|uniref:Uncharacterized protein n=1 Tax=Trichostrongylus colubriformis TaxID=6319 RepID=A0AAN8FX24_TRICO